MTTAIFPTQITTPEEAVRVAQEIERLEAVVTAMKNILKQYVEETGQPVETVDQVWNKWPSESWEFTPEKLKELCQEIAIEGYNPWELLSITKTNLEKIGWSEESLARFGKKKISYRFDKRKRKK